MKLIPAFILTLLTLSFTALPATAEQTAPEKGGLPPDLARAMDFHGHVCFGLVKGYLAIQIAKERLQGPGHKKAPLLPISENKRCGVDAIQTVLQEDTPFNNTVGNRKKGLIIEDVGKEVWKFVRLSDMQGIRVAKKPDAFKTIFPDRSKPYQPLRKKFIRNTATPAEKAQYLTLLHQKIQQMLALPRESAYHVRDLNTDEIAFIQKNYVANNKGKAPTRHICTFCNEEFLSDYEAKVGEQIACIPCANKMNRSVPAADNPDQL